MTATLEIDSQLICNLGRVPAASRRSRHEKLRQDVAVVVVVLLEERPVWLRNQPRYIIPTSWFECASGDNERDFTWPLWYLDRYLRIHTPISEEPKGLGVAMSWKRSSVVHSMSRAQSALFREQQEQGIFQKHLRLRRPHDCQKISHSLICIVKQMRVKAQGISSPAHLNRATDKRRCSADVKSVLLPEAITATYGICPARPPPTSIPPSGSL